MSYRGDVNGHTEFQRLIFNSSQENRILGLQKIELYIRYSVVIQQNIEHLLIIQENLYKKNRGLLLSKETN